ncbi:hypothetical protein GCM10009830_39640 [Glycomyces endophyticus]|uniref:Serine aminopeptidase S33 domain-containing protein n=1 Tax=Glycomyces endophyticus TaxID=480996 RepID=A0ABN2HHZ8_9ACTN
MSDPVPTDTANTGWTPPAYADPTRFTEQAVTVGTGPFAVPGTVSLPARRTPAPAVVLLGGGGPFDRDGTAGPNKPLKDLAWGLAGRGIAVLRFDKPTFAHPEFAAASDLTMTGEYVPYAVDAVEQLADRPEVDADRVFLLGHSMGGKVAPRVAASVPTVAGLVIMAGDTEPMHHAAVRVVTYLAGTVPDQVPASAVETIARQAALVDGPDLTPQTPAGDLPFGLPAPYWLELRDFDPVEEAAALDQPMLIVQGGRDYQVTVADDLARWRSGLADRSGVDFAVFEADDHMFFSGTGPSLPDDYLLPQHVDPEVVDHVADWIDRAQPR